MTSFTIRKSLLHSFLVPLAHIASTSTKLPVAKNIYININSEQITMKATNLTLGLIQNTKDFTNFKGESQEILMMAKPFLDTVNVLPGGDVDFEIDNGQMKISTKQTQTTFQTSEPSQFPILPDLDNDEAQKITMNSDIIRGLVDKTLFSRSTDTTRPVINGVFLSTHDKKLYAATTDGYRLSDFLIGDHGEEVKVILPANFLMELKSVIGDKTGEVNLFIGEDGVKAEFNGSTLFSYIVEGKYPNYKALMPEKNSITLILDKNEFMQTVRTTQVFAREGHSLVVFKTDSKKNEVILRSLATEYGENISIIKTQVSGDMETTLNSRYIVEALNSLAGDRVVMGLDDGMRPAVLRQAKDDDSYIHLIMPIKG